MKLQNGELDFIFILNNGKELPAIGFGTFQSDAGNSQVEDVVLAALRKGYRHIDTATAYGNEEDVGRAIRNSGISREELFITTKLAQTWHQPSDVEEALDQSLKSLQLDYVDLYLMHFPHAYKHDSKHNTIRDPSGSGRPVIDYELSRAYADVWKAMEELVDKGKTKSIGLSNFNIIKTKRILEVGRIRPAVNQVELHPYFPQHELLDFSKKENIHVMAHQPLGGRPVGVVAPNAHRPGPLIDPTIARIALELSKSPAQIILSWTLQHGASVVPKTTHSERLDENLDLFALSEENFRKIDSLANEVGPVRFLDPINHIGFDIFDEEQDQPVANSLHV